ncbi:PilW family protein [Janthinobacterium fluminis]|uniref:PilW family protein n=1 Tax=Janthinobacterium fluminis TaxID=2987524 RepID=A0ABT5K4Q9_9BURK|nr:PilW family protein [Janthinobacterium fluminis]MDC8759984.1 PilW family protein [Janthinobacterium fluminis]
MTRAPIPHRRGGGFSVVELMVSVVIGLLALMFATRLVVSSEQNKQAALGGSDSMQNGMLALFSISSDAGQAGWGLNDPLVAGCDTVFNDVQGYALAPAARGAAVVRPLAAAVIESNGAAPDRLTLYSGSSMSGTGVLRVTRDYAGEADIVVERVPYGFALGDVILAAPLTAGAARCALAQVALDPRLQAGPPAAQALNIATGTAFRFNAAGGLGVNYTNGQAALFNLGPAATLSFHTWSIRSGFLQLRAADLAGAASTASTVVDNVVSLKAQYGFDTRVGAAFTPTSGLQVGRWSATMIDADADGVVGGAGDYQHVAALRLAVVARSKNPDKANASGVCTSSTVAPTVFASAEPAGVTPAPILLNVAVSGDAVDWRCYRYRVFETIVPIRNAGWRPI